MENYANIFDIISIWTELQTLRQHSATDTVKLLLLFTMRNK